jgi:hypothetical protein
MSKASDLYNALDDRTRFICAAQMIHAEIRLIKAEKRRAALEHRKAMAEHNRRIKNMTEFVASLEAKL